ncbi:MAG: hypothetical protein QM740_15070 [Acidovorax sp.]
MKPAPVRRDWVSKTLAGALLGLALAVSASGLFAALAAAMPLPLRGQLAMWMVPPVWLLTWSAVYFFQSGARAWAWLAAVNLLALGAWQALKP